MIALKVNSLLPNSAHPITINPVATQQLTPLPLLLLLSRSAEDSRGSERQRRHAYLYLLGAFHPQPASSLRYRSC